MIVDLFLVYSFIKRLATPFNEWDAYKEGVIDDRGNIILPKKNRDTIKQRKSLGHFDLLVLKLKKLLEKVPGGRSRIASYAAALWLIKEHQMFADEQMLMESPLEINENELVEFVITELFERPYSWQWTNKSDDVFTAKFKGENNIPFEVNFELDFFAARKGKDVWDITFENASKDVKRTDKMNVLGTGDEIGVFSTVMDIIKGFVKLKNPDNIHFSAYKSKTGKADSRARLYDRMVKKYASSIGYDFSISQDIRGNQLYNLTRKGLKENEDSMMTVKTPRHDKRKKKHAIASKSAAIEEDAPTNNVGSGNIAGLDGTALSVAAQKRWVEKNKKNKKVKTDVQLDKQFIPK